MGKYQCGQCGEFQEQDFATGYKAGLQRAIEVAREKLEFAESNNVPSEQLDWLRFVIRDMRAALGTEGE